MLNRACWLLDSLVLACLCELIFFYFLTLKIINIIVKDYAYWLLLFVWLEIYMAKNSLNLKSINIFFLQMI